MFGLFPSIAGVRAVKGQLNRLAAWLWQLGFCHQQYSRRLQGIVGCRWRSDRQGHVLEHAQLQRLRGGESAEGKAASCPLRRDRVVEPGTGS